MASSPKAPDPYQTASAQQSADTSAGITQSIIGNPNTYTPYGAQSYQISGYEQVPDANGNMMSVPRYNMTQTLSPDQQRLLDLSEQSGYNLGQTAVEQSSKLRKHLGTEFNTAGMQGWAGQTNEPTDRKAIEDAMMKTYQRQVQPQQQAENAQLAARGMSPGSKGMGTVQQGRDDAASNASLQAYLASGAESRDASGFLNNLREQQLGEGLALRNQPINEITALMSGGQVTLPQFQQYTSQGVNAAPVGQYIGNNYAQASANTNAFNSGLFGLAGIGGQTAGKIWG
jgi:hypothetical protein